MLFLWYNPCMFEKETDLGQIHFSRSVIERIIKDAVSECDGKVFLSNYKGKYMRVVPGSDYTIEQTDDGIDITVYVVIAFGAGIGRYSKQMLEHIYDNVEKVMGERPHYVKIVVTGVQSKKEIARRHVEIDE